jgi:hypothetical protein
MNLKTFFQIKENQAMRERYGYWAPKMLAVLIVLLSFSAANAVINPKYEPTLSVRNYTVYPDGTLRIPAPAPGGDRYFLVPVFIYNQFDPAYNPNVGGQFIEPIRSFNFQLTYFTQAMVLDTTPSHGPAVVTIGPGMGNDSLSAIAKNFYIRYSDILAPGDTNPNPYRHIIRVTGASEIPLPLVDEFHPIPGTTHMNSDTTAVLVYIRFKVVINSVQAGLLQLDSSLFNDHYGDSLPNALTYKRGNFGGDPQAKGQGFVSITDQPAFDFRPYSQITTTDNVNFKLLSDLIYDPTILGSGNPQQAIQVRNAIGTTRLTNITVVTNQPWLNVSQSPGGGQHTIFIPRIDYTSSFGSEEKDLWISADGGTLPPGIYFGIVTLTSDGALNSPARILVRLIVRRRPNEPSTGNGTGIRLTLTNSCLPQCSNTITFGTGPGATAGLDPLYGETVFSTNDRLTRDTNVVAGQRCWAYFRPFDLNVDPAFQDPTFLGTDRDIRNENTDTTILYKVIFSAGSGATNCYPVTVCVDPSDFPAGARIIARDTLNGSQFSVDLRNATENGNQRCFVIRDPRITSFVIEYTPGTIGKVPSFVKNGWNLISLPVIPPDLRAKTIFPNSAGNPYEYRADIGWTTPLGGLLEFGRGYMLKYGSTIGNDSIVAGIRTKSIHKVRIDQGWNTIGSISVTTSVAGISFEPLPGNLTIPTQISDVYEFIPARGYRTVAYITPGKGYFVKTDSSGYYDLDFVPNKATVNPSGELMQSLAKVTVRDAGQNAQDLYFGSSNTEVKSTRFELPPYVNGLDARFTSNKGFIEYNQNGYNVAIKSTSYPVAMNFSNVVGQVEVRDLSGNLLGTAVNGGTVVINDANVNQVVITSKATATAVNASGFALEQNYPNPFNPSTSIFYTVPAETNVTLTVYNALGQVVRTLVNGTVASGRHEVRFDASELASGTYMYTLKAGNFTQSARMILSK